MKKFFGAVLIAAILLAGCGGSAGKSDEQDAGRDISIAAEVTGDGTDAAGSAGSEGNGDSAASDASFREYVETLKEYYTHGFVGVAETGERVFLALDEYADYGLFGLVSDESSLFLEGSV